MTRRWLALWLLVAVLCWLVIIGTAALVIRVAGVVAFDPAPWSPPPSAIVSLTTAPGKQQSLGPASQDVEVAFRRATGTVDGTAASPGLPRGTGAEADYEALAASRLPTRSVAAHSLAELVFVGVASTYGPGWPVSLVALPQGPGWRFRVCGQGGCLVLTSTDKGPDQRLFPDRVVDLPVWAFERVSGQPWTRGITTVVLTVVLRRTPWT